MYYCASFKAVKNIGCAHSKSTNEIYKKDWILKWRIRQVPHLRKVRKLTNYLSPPIVDLRFAELICGPLTTVIQPNKL